MVLESVCFPGQHVGVRESGEVKKPSHTGKGKHAQFTPIVIGIYIHIIMVAGNFYLFLIAQVKMKQTEMCSRLYF